MRRRLLAFLVVGLFSFIIDFGLLSALLIANMHVLAATSAAFFVSLAFNYVCNARLTFQAEASLRSVLRFGVLTFVNYALTLVCVGLVHSELNAPLLGKLIAVPTVAMNSYLWSRYWVFGHPHRSH
jgi:putative flippase GtrA